MIPAPTVVIWKKRPLKLIGSKKLEFYLYKDAGQQIRMQKEDGRPVGRLMLQRVSTRSSTLRVSLLLLSPEVWDQLPNTSL